MSMNCAYLEYILDGPVVQLAINNDQVCPLVSDDAGRTDAVFTEERHLAERGTRNYRRTFLVTGGKLRACVKDNNNSLGIILMTLMFTYLPNDEKYCFW